MEGWNLLVAGTKVVAEEAGYDGPPEEGGA
jgi:hypothetical protein